MLRSRLGDVAGCRINKTTKWLWTQNYSKLVNDAKSERKSIVLKIRNNMENYRNERLNKMRLIAPIISNKESLEESDSDEF